MITEAMLILPALYVIYHNGQITMTELIKELNDFFKPTGNDAAILPGRNDTYFSQRVRNLRSHRDYNGMKDYTNLFEDRYSLTSTGETYLMQSDNYEIINYLFSNKFTNVDIVNILQQTVCNDRTHRMTPCFEDEMIAEGRVIRTSLEKRLRSQRLRSAAVEYYARNGSIRCAVCDFSFEECYGVLGKGFIEIHHERPVCQYSSMEFEEFLRDAILFVKPVCANCHRMLHRDKKHPLTIQELRESIILPESNCSLHPY